MRGNGAYEELLEHVLTTGQFRPDRTGTGAYSSFGHTLVYDLSHSFPLITTKKVALRLVAEELLWFLRGEGNITSLKEKDVHIWDEWADENGDLGPVYGVQWRSWPTSDGGHVDQIRDLVEGLRVDPFSRRHIVSAWNVGQLHEMALPPCHLMFQFYVSAPQRPGDSPVLSCQVYQRSADLFLGVPFNIASYALLTHLIADFLGYEVGELRWVGGDCHIYANHEWQVQEQVKRTPRRFPLLWIDTSDVKTGTARQIEDVADYRWEDIQISGYYPHPVLKGEVAV